jgi:hypothetical protein
MVKTDRRSKLRVFPFQAYRAPDSFLDGTLPTKGIAVGLRFRGVGPISHVRFALPAQMVDATLACSLLAGV